MSSCEDGCYAYCAEFEKTKALSESKAADNISAHQRPPLEDVDNAVVVGTVIGNLVNGKLNLLADNVLKVLSDICLGEPLCKQTATKAM